MKRTLRISLLLSLLLFGSLPAAQAQYFSPQENQNLLTLGLGPRQYDYSNPQQYQQLKEIVQIHKKIRAREAQAIALIFPGMLLTVAGIAGIIMGIQTDDDITSLAFVLVSTLPLGVGIAINIEINKLYKKVSLNKEKRQLLINNFHSAWD